MVTSNMILPCHKETAWDIVTNNQEYAWRSDIKQITIVDETNFIEYTKKDYPTYFTITQKELYQRYEFDIKNTNITGHWIGTFEDTSNGCKIELIEQIEVKNIIMKVFAKMYLKKQQKIYIQDITKKVSCI
jgi:hypothetical protein